MKLFLSILIFSYAFTLADIERKQKIVDMVNNLKTTWKAKVYNRDFLT